LKNNTPSNEVFKKLALIDQQASLTQWNNCNIITRVKARSPESTFIMGNSISSWIPSIDSNTYQEFSRKQDSYLAQSGAFHLSGCISNQYPARTKAEFQIERNCPNIAAMQAQLLFPCDISDGTDIKIIYTPNLLLDGFPNKRGILIDLDHNVTRIFGSDYFGESKKAGLRMWNKMIYDKGGLAFHAGCKSYQNSEENERSMLIIGLSGTGKTTTTFTKHANSKPIQDDFCAYFQDGKIYASENGCFAKTYGLDPIHEPSIFKGVTHPDAWLENVFVDENGIVDFRNDKHTTNGRGTFPMRLIPHGDLDDIPPLGKILILNRDFNIIPAIAKISGSQAAAYFMLGETMGTSAGGKSEAGKALRVPGTNPFFPLDHALQANRFLDLLKNSPEVEVYLMNTGHIGQDENMQGGEKITIEHSRTLIEAMLQDQLQWESDPDFGYQIIDANHSPIDYIFTNPRMYYLQNNRISEYKEIINRVRKDRLRFLEPYKKLDHEIFSTV